MHLAAAVPGDDTDGRLARDVAGEEFVWKQDHSVDAPLARDFLEAHTSERVARYVRINPLASGLALDDLAATAAGRPDGILLPKCLPDDVRTLDHYLSAFEAAAGSPVGATRIVAIATETPAAVTTPDQKSLPEIPASPATNSSCSSWMAMIIAA